MIPPIIASTMSPVNLCWFLLLEIPMSIGLIGVIIFFGEDYVRAKVEKSVLECRWCKSRFSSEILKTIERVLIKRGIMYKIQNRNYVGKGLLRDMVLPQENVMISFFGPMRSTTWIAFTKQYSNWVGIGTTKPQNKDSLKSLEYLKSEILQIIREMPVKNEFCKRCDGTHNSICYGGVSNSTIGGHVAAINTLLEKIDPFKDEETLQYLINRKEKLGNKKIKKRSEYQDLVDISQENNSMMFTTDEEKE